MASSSSSLLSSFAVGEISQVLSSKRKRKKTHGENSDLQSLFSGGLPQQPVFVHVVPKKTEKKKVEVAEPDTQQKIKKRKVDSDSKAIDGKENNQRLSSRVTLSNKRKTSESESDPLNQRTRRRKPKKVPEDPDKQARTVFVGNLPVTMKKKVFRKFFSKHGEVESVRFRSAALAKPNLSRTVGMKRKEFHQDRHSFNGYVVYKDVESARKALKSNGEEIEGFHIRVDQAENSKVHDHNRSVFVGNLRFDTEEQPLREVFSSCGEVESVRLIRDSKTGIGKGFGYVLFKSKDAATFALRLNGSEFKGRQIRVFSSSQNPQAGHVQKIKRGKPHTHSFSGMRATKQNKEQNRKKGKPKNGKQTFSSKPRASRQQGGTQQKRTRFDSRKGKHGGVKENNSFTARKGQKPKGKHSNRPNASKDRHKGTRTKR